MWGKLIKLFTQEGYLKYYWDVNLSYQSAKLAELWRLLFSPWRNICLKRISGQSVHLECCWEQSKVEPPPAQWQQWRWRWWTADWGQSTECQRGRWSTQKWRLFSHQKTGALGGWLDPIRMRNWKVNLAALLILNSFSIHTHTYLISIVLNV